MMVIQSLSLKATRQACCLEAISVHDSGSVQESRDRDAKAVPQPPSRLPETQTGASAYQHSGNRVLRSLTGALTAMSIWLIRLVYIVQWGSGSRHKS